MVVGECGDVDPVDKGKVDTAKFAKKYEISIDAGYYASPTELGEKLCNLILQTKRDNNENPVEQKLFFEHDYRKQRSRFYSKGPGTFIMSESPDFFTHLGLVNFTMESTEMKEKLNMETRKRETRAATYFIRSIGKDAKVTAGSPADIDL